MDIDNNKNTTQETRYQSGSNDQVLVNKLGIRDRDKIEELEFDLLTAFQADLFIQTEVDQVITVQDLCDWHHDWLGTVFEWAGKYRNIDITNTEFPVAQAQQVPVLMAEFDRNVLARYTPCSDMEFDHLIEALAMCHSDLLMVHPFREGNGRIARLLDTVMALQADMPPLDFEVMEKKRERYISALRTAHSGNYDPMKKLFSQILNFSLEQAAQQEGV